MAVTGYRDPSARRGSQECGRTGPPTKYGKPGLLSERWLRSDRGSIVTIIAIGRRNISGLEIRVHLTSYECWLTGLFAHECVMRRRAEPARQPIAVATIRDPVGYRRMSRRPPANTL